MWLDSDLFVSKVFGRRKNLTTLCCVCAVLVWLRLTPTSTQTCKGLASSRYPGSLTSYGIQKMVVFGTCVVCITEFWINLFAAAGPKACSRFGRNLVSWHGVRCFFYGRRPSKLPVCVFSVVAT